MANSTGPKNDGLVSAYFKKHTIQRPYSFLVEFFNSQHDPEREFDSHQVKTVSLPSFSFKKEFVKVGGVLPIAFPVLDSDGLEMKIEFEEDDTASINKMIMRLQRRIIDSRGYHRFPLEMKFGDIRVGVFDYAANPVFDYYAKGCSFLKSEEIKYSYTETNPIGYIITFVFDSYEYKYYKNKTNNTDLTLNTPDRITNLDKQGAFDVN